ncbi:MAG: hypothetical protein AB1449_14610 [Chloroflexota bacterium]
MDGSDGPVKLLISYDPVPEKQEAYFQYVLGEFVPALAKAGLPMCEVWHTAYGSYPLRLAGFLARDLQSLRHVLASEAFHRLEARLQEYVLNYHRRVVPARRGFQF